MNASLQESSVTETKLTMGQIRRCLIQRERVNVYEQNTGQLTEAGSIVNVIIDLQPAYQVFGQAGCRLLSNNSLLRILRFFAVIFSGLTQIDLLNRYHVGQGQDVCNDFVIGRSIDVDHTNGAIPQTA